MQLTKEELIGFMTLEDVPHSTASRIADELLAALRAQADARPVARWRRNAQGGIDFTVIGDPYVVDEAALYTHPEASAPGLSREQAKAIADSIIADYREHYDFPTQGESHMHDCIMDALTRASAATAKADDELSTKNFQSPSELKGCPFCGGNACMKEVLDGDRTVGYRAHCANFWCTGWQPCLTSQTPEVAASVWNKRHSAATVAEPGADERAGVAECKWSPDSYFEGDTWDSACGEKWSFIDGGPAENRVRFCQGCGGRVVIAAPTQREVK